MPIVTIDPTQDARWSALMARADPSLFHSPSWMRAVCEAYGFAPSALIEIDESGEPRAGVAFCRVDDVLGERLVSFPFSDVCDPLVADHAAWPALLEALVGTGLPMSFRCLDQRWLSNRPGFAIGKRARWQMIEMSDSAERLRSRFADTTERGIAKAERAGIVVRPITTADELSQFVRLHVRLRKIKYRLLAQPAAFFASIHQRFHEAGDWHAVGAYHDDRMIAAVIYLRCGDTLYFKFNASDPEALQWRPNNVLVWAGFQIAESLKCRALDLGPSDDNQPGLIRFKRGFGATSGELCFWRWTPPGYDASHNANLRRVLGRLTQLFTEPATPDAVAAEAGAGLYRYFV